MATHTSTPVSVAAALARLGGRRARLGSAAALETALEAADLPPEILTAIEVASSQSEGGEGRSHEGRAGQGPSAKLGMFASVSRDVIVLDGRGAEELL